MATGPYDYASQVGKAGAQGVATSAPPTQDVNNPYRAAAFASGNNKDGAAYDPFANYDWAKSDPYLGIGDRGALLNAASMGTAQVRNPYDYVIGRDQDYVGNMAAQQQQIGQATQQGYTDLGASSARLSQGAMTTLANQGAAATAYGQQMAGQINNGGNALSAYGQQAASGINSAAAAMSAYGKNAAGAINAGANSMFQSGTGMLDTGSRAGGRQAYALDFGQQSNALGGSLSFADQLGNMQQGPSGAQAMLQSGANQSMAQSLALARSGRGFGGSAAGQAQALQQNAATMQQAGNQSAMLNAQETAQWNAQRAQNLGQAANVYQGAGSQYGQQQALGAQSSLQNAQQNDAFASSLYGLGLQGQGAALNAQANAAQLGVGSQQAALNAQAQAGQLGVGAQQAALGAQTQAGQLGLNGMQTGSSIYGQGATLGMQGLQQQGQMLGSGSQAASQGGLNAFGFNQAQNATDMSRENMISQDFATKKGIGIQQQQLNNQEAGSYIGAIGTGLGIMAMAASDERVKKNIVPVGDFGSTLSALDEQADPYGINQGVLQRRSLDTENPYGYGQAPPRILDRQNPYTDLRPAQAYSYEYTDPEKFGQGRFVGPMAQDLEKSPATESAVFTDTDGVKKIDTSRLALVNTSAISEQQRRIDELEKMLAAQSRSRAGVTSDKRTKTNVKRYRAPATEPDEPPVNTKGYGFGYRDFYRDVSPSNTMVDTRRAHLLPTAEAQNAARFDQLESATNAARPLPETSPIKAFARNAAAHALDTAALPVTLPAQAAEALGYHNKLAHLDANTALEGLDYLSDPKAHDPEDYRFRVNEERLQNPTAAAAGAIAGDSIGGAGEFSLASRAFSRGAGALRGLGPGAGSRTPRALAAKEFLKSHPNVESLERYMKSGYDEINSSLRAAHGVHPTNLPLDLQQKALARSDQLQTLLDAATAEGHVQPGTVTRGMELPVGTTDKWLKHGALENKSFWSTTANPTVSESFATMTGERNAEKVLLRIKQKSAVPVGAVNGGYEDELLLPRDKKWEITGHHRDDRGFTVIDLKQVDKFKPGVTPALTLHGEGERLADEKLRALIREPAQQKEHRYGR